MVEYSQPEYVNGELKPIEDYTEADLDQDTWTAWMNGMQCYKTITHKEVSQEFFKEFDARADKDQILKELAEIDEDFMGSVLDEKDEGEFMATDSYWNSLDQTQKMDFYVAWMKFFRPFFFKHRVLASKQPASV